MKNESLRRVCHLLVAAVAVVSLTGCTAGSVVAEVSLDDVVAANVDAGMDPAVAQCLVGIGSQQLPLDVLSPNAERTADQTAMIEQLTTSCEEASAFVLDEPLQPDSLAFDDQPFTFGDDPVFDRLWERCEAGDGVACDQLWEEAPVGSEYERFGVTCGDRDQLLDCSEDLTEETVEAIDAAAAAKAAAKDDRTDANQPS